MNRRIFLRRASAVVSAVTLSSQFGAAVAQSVDESSTFRRPKTILPVPTPSPQFQHVETEVPDSQLTREATGLLR